MINVYVASLSSRDIHDFIILSGRCCRIGAEMDMQSSIRCHGHPAEHDLEKRNMLPRRTNLHIRH